MPVPTLISQLSTTASLNSPDGAVDVPSSIDDYQRAHAAFIAQLYASTVKSVDIQNQTVTAFTTGGTSTAYTLTPTPAITANAANQRFRVKFNAAAGTTPTLAVSGQAALNLKYKDSAGTKQAITSTQVPINWISDVENDGTDWVVLDVPLAAAMQGENQSLATSGYQKLPGGLIIQWGTASIASTAAGATTSQTVTYPIAFPNGAMAISASVSTATIGTEFFTASANKSSASQALIKCRNSFGSSASTASVDWIAIGY
jgi:hypothetical protein